MSELGIFSGSTGFLLHRLGIGADRLIDETLRPHGVRARELRVLALLGDEPKSQAQLVDASGLDRTTMVAVVDRLEKGGFVRRQQDPADRRKQAVSPTGEGERLLAFLAGQLRDAEAEFLQPLSAGQQTDLNLLLATLFAERAPRC